MDYTKQIDKLFKAAKAKDEFEYACSMLNFQGVQDAGWDPLQETIYLYEDLTGLLAAPLKQETRARLALLLYCHLTEAEAVYRIIYNMLRVTQNHRYSAFPFEPLVKKLKNGDRIEPTVRKIVNKIDEYSNNIGYKDIGDLVKQCVNHELRNAFYHSDYNLHNSEFRSKGSWFVHANNVRSQVLSNEELSTIINAGIGFFQSFMFVYMKHRQSYKKNKVVQGRLTHDDSYTTVTLTAKKQGGLYGFKSIGGYDDLGVKE